MSEKTHFSIVDNSLYGVIGNPIAHSKSPKIHNFWLSELKIDCNYQKFLLNDKKNLKDFLLSKKGANITLPYKEEALKIVDFASEEARIIGAANTIINENLKLKAYNTDAFGFFEPIKKFNFKNALLIGAGGAARAVYYALMRNKIPTFVVNRSKKDNFLTTVNTKLDSFEFDLVVNSTSASLFDELPLLEDDLHKISKNASFVYDLAYSHDVFLDFFSRQNIIKQDGLDMLVYQAALAFKHFFGVYPSKDLIENAKELIK